MGRFGQFLHSLVRSNSMPTLLRSILPSKTSSRLFNTSWMFSKASSQLMDFLATFTLTWEPLANITLVEFIDRKNSLAINTLSSSLSYTRIGNFLVLKNIWPNRDGSRFYTLESAKIRSYSFTICILSATFPILFLSFS